MWDVGVINLKGNENTLDFNKNKFKINLNIRDI